MATEDARKLFVAGLPETVTEDTLRNLFLETKAQVTELTLPRDRATGRPRGFAFVRLGSTDEAERARQELDGRIVDGKMISVRPFQAEPPGPREARGPGGPPRDGGGFGDRPPRREGGFGGGDRGPGPGGPGGPGGGGFGGGDRGGPGGPAAQDRTLYVGNLPYDATQEEIETLLRESGVDPVVRVYLPLDQDGRKRGFGFVTLGSAETANNAIEQLKNAELRSRRLIINIAHPKGSGPREGGGPGGPPGDRPPRTFGGGGGGFAGGGGFGGGGPPPPPRTGKGEGRKRRFEDGGGGGGGGAGGGDRGPAGGAGAAGKRRDREERWRDQDDDDW